MIIRFVWVGIANLMSGAYALAIPFVYTFTGTITDITLERVVGGTTDISHPSTAIIGGVDFTLNEILSYEFIVDFAQDGFCVDPSAVQCDPTAIVDQPPFVDYFYVGLLGVSKSVPLNYLEAEFNYGLSLPGGPSGQLAGGSAISILGNEIVQDWQPGFLVNGLDSWDNGVDFSGNIKTDLTLASIRPLSVPEPGILGLLGTGMICFLMSLRKSTLVRMVHTGYTRA